MVDTSAAAARHVEGLDPHPLLEAEQLRALDFFAGLDEDGWQMPTGCPAWRRREMAAHLSSSEGYNLSTLDGTREAFVAAGVAAGAHDLDSFNDWGVRSRSDWPVQEVLDELREKSAAARAGLRARGEGDVDTMVGPYPARLQAFHLAFEAAIHNDDMDVPIGAADQAGRDAWRAPVARFLIEEEGRPVELEAVRSGTRVRHSATGKEAVFPDADLVKAASGRLADRAQLYPTAVVEALTGQG